MKFVLSFLFLVFSSFALEFNQIDKTMENKINKTLQILQTSNQSINTIAQEIFNLFDMVFDYELMAKLSLSKKYKD